MNKDLKNSKPPVLLLIIIALLMVAMILYEFISCVNGGGDTWRYDHL